MSQTKTIAVVGATGAQGGGVVRAILDDPAAGLTPRAITRKPDSDKARELARLGAEVVQADTDDETSLIPAFQGAWGAFCVTNFWEHFSPEREMAQAGNMARAAKAAGVHHVIWSTLEDTRGRVPLDDDRMPTLKERYKVPHFDGKGESDRLFTELGLPVTLLLTSFYWDNMVFFGMEPKRGEDGTLRVVFPMGDRKLPGIGAEDIGGCVHGIFKAGDAWIGRTVGIAGGHPTGAEMAASLTKALGEETVYIDVPPDVYRAFGFPGSDDLGNMFQYKRDFNDEYCAARNLDVSRSLNPRLRSFDEWLADKAGMIPRG